jgi:hypothetical protein
MGIYDEPALNLSKGGDLHFRCPLQREPKQ